MANLFSLIIKSVTQFTWQLECGQGFWFVYQIKFDIYRYVELLVNKFCAQIKFEG